MINGRRNTYSRIEAVNRRLGAQGFFPITGGEMSQAALEIAYKTSGKKVEISGDNARSFVSLNEQQFEKSYEKKLLEYVITFVPLNN